jgi:putative redox protein
MTVHVTKAENGKLAQQITIGTHTLLADVGSEWGGDDLGIDPHDLFDAALGACTALTLKMFASRKNIALEHVEVEVVRDNSEEKAGHYRLKRVLTFFGNLSDAEKATLLEIADKCPIHRLMQRPVEITTVQA